MVQAKENAVICPWCEYNIHGCQPKDCDFKSLRMEKKAILERMQQELDAINKAKRLLVSNRFAGDPKMVVLDIVDKLKGLDIMFKVLWKKFGMGEAEVKSHLTEVEKFSVADRLKLAIRFKSVDRGRKGNGT